MITKMELRSTKWAHCYCKNGTNRLAWHRIATTLQLVKNAIIVICTIAKHNKMRCSYIYNFSNHPLSILFNWIIITHLTGNKTKAKKAKKLGQEPTANKWQSSDSDPGLSVYRVPILSSKPPSLFIWSSIFSFLTNGKILDEKLLFGLLFC